ncbi:uncharacterized protein LOC103703173 [Phoenix dactylifera]|uniref:Uncharacterized protein LOC103703173 n=1 Tax=Phoenix dactylifera TaxID=42345 RepID=A0A8B7BRY1_PHODC|nr:uncharacterized protein LOC103703173 [Phoenix dactylifera]XP_008784157.2 uncharacterized protein LOC103703173 [Phoenix dactylifera]XP_008784158.2 uncharacterized protein LOC103703173 [Phoenix dactylifera]
MEQSLPASNMMPASYGVLDLQGSVRKHHQHHPQESLRRHPQQASSIQHQRLMVHSPIMHEVFPLNANHMKDFKTSMSDDGDASFTEDGVHDQDDAGKRKKGPPWQRMKWTDRMVRLLITAVSYIGEDAMPEYNNGGRRKCAVLQKKRKWKSISRVMAERGCYVSPQQCEDKFNDLNKRYKRLIDILGRGTACMVVENPALLGQMEHISDKLKDEVKKILSSKQLFYEEMCSYHNANRLHLPHDLALRRSLQLALSSRDEHDTRRAVHGNNDEDDRSAGTDDEEDDAQEHAAILHGDAGDSCLPKRLKHLVDHEEVSFGDPSGLQPHPQDMSAVAWGQKHSKNFPLLQLEEQRWKIQLQMLELEKQSFEWQRFSKKKDRELNKLRMENERMKLENERLALELKRRELEVDLNLKRYQS